MHYDAVIVGAGPGGLACATRLAQHDVKVLIIDRKKYVGPKSCAGGITYNGLIGTTPLSLIEKSFRKQYVISTLQKHCVSEKEPIIATVNRDNFGQHMAIQATSAGAELKTATIAQNITSHSLEIKNIHTQKVDKITFTNLIGADGSTSIIRRYLAVPSEKMGVAINYQIEGEHDRMEWHLLGNYFDNGYGWIFPHKTSVSIGAYIPQRSTSLSQLNRSLIEWGNTIGYDLSRSRCSAGYINYDYRGHQFDNIFLVGDAAGLASALTGEGIFPAIVSGKSVANCIVGKDDSPNMDKLIVNQKRFAGIVRLTGKSRVLSSLIAEVGILGLRCKLIDFTMLEMSK